MKLDLDSKTWLEFGYYWNDPMYVVRFLKQLVAKPELIRPAQWADFGTAITFGGKCNSQSAYASIPYIVEYAQKCDPNDNNRFSALFLVGNVEFIRQHPKKDVIKSFLEQEYFKVLRIAEKLVLESIFINCWSGNDLSCLFSILAILRGKFGAAVLQEPSLIEHLRCKECGNHFEFWRYDNDMFPNDIV